VCISIHPARKFPIVFVANYDGEDAACMWSFRSPSINHIEVDLDLHRFSAPSAQRRMRFDGADIGEEFPAAFAFGVGADFDTCRQF
jgi:hypothetical protein